MSENLKIWDQVCRVPKEHLKGFKRAGGFTGTAIKPMWSVHKMTEMFGPCGHGWGINEPRFEVVTAGDEIMVYCTVSIWTRNENDKLGDGYVFGVGGDKVRAVFDRGPKNDDEAFKKAFTDAVTNALKHLGVGADVHMGLWDGNKYVDEATHEKPAAMPAANGTPGASKAANRAVYDKMVMAIRNTPTIAGLKTWYSENVNEIDALPADWLDMLRVEYEDRLSELKKLVAA